MTQETAPIPLLAQRRVEASFIKPFLAALVAELGADRARSLVGSVVEELARSQGRAARPSSPPGLAGLAKVWDGLATGGALEIDRREQSDERLYLRVSRCRYAEMYRELGLESWGATLSCSRDAPFAEGLCPAARLTRSKPLMEGGPYCEFLYTLVNP